jgi:hypothetical protein
LSDFLLAEAVKEIVADTPKYESCQVCMDALRTPPLYFDSIAIEKRKVQQYAQVHPHRFGLRSPALLPEDIYWAPEMNQQK